MTTERDRVERPGLARSVKALRLARGLKQQDLAARADLAVSVVARIEQGKTTNPTMDTLFRLADALAVSMDDLTGYRSDPVAPQE